LPEIASGCKRNGAGMRSGIPGERDRMTDF